MSDIEVPQTQRRAASSLGELITPRRGDLEEEKALAAALLVSSIAQSPTRRSAM
jgi:hypothetical protein